MVSSFPRVDLRSALEMIFGEEENGLEPRVVPSVVALPWETKMA